MTGGGRNLDGIIAVPATPFTEDDRVDEASLRQYARVALARGVVGFLAPAVAGEAELLTEPERERVVTILLEESAGRVPVIGGVTDPDPTARRRRARQFIELGCQGILAYVKFEYEDAYARAVSGLAELQPGFLMLQDLDAGARAVPVALLARLHREVPAFTWIKIETPDRCRKCSALIAATSGTLRVGTAGPELIEALDRGAHAYLPTLYHDMYAEIWQLHRSGQREAAVELHRRLLPCLTFVANHPAIQWSISKAVLQAEGIFATTRVRAPTSQPDAVERRLISDLCEYARRIRRELDNEAKGS